MEQAYSEPKRASGGSKGGALGAPPPTDQNFLNFMQFFGKTWQICMLVPPPRRILDPPLRALRINNKDIISFYGYLSLFH